MARSARRAATASDIGVAEITAIVRSLRITLAVNALGLPAVALPAGIAGGLPQGVQIIGARYREDLCLDAAAAVKRAAGILTPIDPRASATRP